LGINPEVFRADALYKEGKYVGAIKTALERKDDIARILKEVSGRAVPMAGAPLTLSARAAAERTPHVSRVLILRRRLWTTNASAVSKGTVSMRGGGKLVLACGLAGSLAHL